jgi:hypothetical protein
VLVPVGRFDASGMDISHSFVEMTSCWKKFHRIGLDEGLSTRSGLPVLRGKATDSRAADFIAAHPEIHARHGFGADESANTMVPRLRSQKLNRGRACRWAQRARSRCHRPGGGGPSGTGAGAADILLTVRGGPPLPGAKLSAAQGAEPRSTRR